MTDYKKAFKTFDEDQVFAWLDKKVNDDQSFYQKNKNFALLVRGMSFMFNAISILAAFYAVHYLVGFITQNQIINFALTGVIFLFLETVKRKSSSEFWQVFWFKREYAMGWAVLSLSIFILSVMSSSFGIKQGVDDFAPIAETVVSNVRLEQLNEEIKDSKKRIKDSKKMTYGGNMTGDAHSIMNESTKALARAEKERAVLWKQMQEKNIKIEKTYAAEVEDTGWIMVSISIACEMLFELCICYIWFFYHRSYLERNLGGGSKKKAHNPSHTQQQQRQKHY